MTAIYDIRSHYQKIISDLQNINPKLSLEEIKEDTETILRQLFIEKIKELEIPAKISSLEHRKKLIKYRLQSQRLPKKSKDYKYKGIKIEEKYLKFSRLKENLKKRELYLNLSHSGNCERDYIFANDETYIHKNITRKKQEESYKFKSESKFENDNTFLNKPNSHEDLDYSFSDYSSFFPERQNLVEIFKKEELISKKEKQVDLDKELVNKIKELEIKPLKKEKSEDFSFIEYIGFVDK